MKNCENCEHGNCVSALSSFCYAWPSKREELLTSARISISPINQSVLVVMILGWFALYTIPSFQIQWKQADLEPACYQ